MSEMVHYKGTLYKVEKRKNETLEEQCQRILGVDTIKDYYDSFQEMVADYLSEEYVIVDDVLYSYKMKEIDLDIDFFSSRVVNNNTIDFEVRFYNGGCGFSEAIGYAIKNKETKGE